MFLQPPEELVGPSWSMNVIPTFATHAALSGDDVAGGAPGFLLQARSAVDKYPDSPIAAARLAQAAQAAGAADEALAHARRAIELGLDAKESGVVHAAMTLLAASGRGSDALAVVDDPRADAIPIGVRVRAAAAAGEYDAAERLPDVDSSPDALAVIAWIRTEQGDYQGAIRAGRLAERGGASGVTLFANLGYAHAAAGNLKKAIRFARQAHALSPADRQLGLTLAQYLHLANRHEAEMQVLQSLQVGERVDTELALAIAKALTYVGKTTDAHRVLERTRQSQEWTVADTTSRAELTANLALLRWITRRDRAESSLKDILLALQACDYQSLGIAYLLTNLMRTPAHANELARVIGRLANRHPEHHLHGLRMLLAILERDTDKAVRQSEAWVRHDPFSPFAAANATLLVGEVKGDFKRATEIGIAALRRAPHDPTLLNNTAFVAAMDSQLELARKLVRHGVSCCGEQPHLTATQGLIELLEGNTGLGRSSYRRAEKLARERGDNALAARVLLYAALAERAAGVDLTFGDPEQLLVAKVLEPWQDLPSFWVARERVSREGRGDRTNS
jgi:tetratricopeptide (TPR) repeat protein